MLNMIKIKLACMRSDGLLQGMQLCQSFRWS